MAATHVVSTDLTTTSLRTAIQCDKRQDNLIVIDWINMKGSTAAAAVVSLELTDDNALPFLTVGSSLAAGDSDTIFMAFPDGLPCWRLVDGTLMYSSPVPTSTVYIAASYGDAGGRLNIGYHFERPTNRR